MYFDRSYADGSFSKRLAVHRNQPAAVELKLNNAAPQDRMVLVSKGQACGSASSASRDSTLLFTGLTDAKAGNKNPYVTATLSPYSFNVNVGEFDICYCWITRYTGERLKPSFPTLTQWCPQKSPALTAELPPRTGRVGSG